MTGIPLLIVFCLAIILMIVAISKFHIHPFLSLMGTSLVLAVVVGLPLEKIPGIIGSGFSGVFSSIGIVIILGALIGLILEKTGAAIRLADVVIRFVGEKHPQLALMLMGWIVSIPVFCDSGFVILNPIRKALCRKLKGASPAGMAVALSAGLYAAHVFIPPTPGPIAAAGSLGLADHLAGVILAGVIASVPALAAAYIFSLYIAKKDISVHADEKESPDTEKSYEELVAGFGKLPGAFSSFAPIVIPVILMALGSFVSMIGLQGSSAVLCKFFATPIIALTVGLLLAVRLLVSTHTMNRFAAITDETLKTVGPIHESQCRFPFFGRHFLPIPDFCHPEDGAGQLHGRDHHDSGHHGHVHGLGFHDVCSGSAVLNGCASDGHGDRRGRDDCLARQ